MLPIAAYAYITPGEFLGGSTGGNGSDDGGLPIPTLDLGGGDGGDNGLPIPTLDLGGGDGGDNGLPIPCLDCLFPAGSSSSSSSSDTGSDDGGDDGGGTSGGGRGVDPNYILYGTQYPEGGPYYQYPPYQPYPSPVPYPPNTPTLSIRDPNSGAPLTNTGPAEFMLLSVLGGSIVFTLKHARRAEKKMR